MFSGELDELGMVGGGGRGDAEGEEEKSEERQQHGCGEEED